MSIGVEHLSTVGMFEGRMGVDIDSLRYRPQYELGTNYFIITDPNHGEPEYIGDEADDQILVDLAHSDVMRRLITIEQLTLPEQYATIPDSYHFSRWEHVWGSLVFVRRMAKMMGLDQKESMYLQLKVLLSDFKHTAFSHAGDWMFQGEGGPEDDHENRLRYAEMTGICNLLKRYRYDAGRVFDDKTHDITDMPKGQNDADRIDYTMREGNRWVDQTPSFKEHLNADSFEVRNGRIVAKNRFTARVLAMTHTLLVTQNWQEPVHRLQLNMFLEELKRIFVARNGHGDEWASYSPRDLMGTADHTIIDKISEHDEFIGIIDQILRTVSRSERTSRWIQRREVSRAMIDFAGGGDPQQVEWVKKFYDRLPSNLEIENQHEASPNRSKKYTTTIKLKKLRKRFIDPEYIEGDEIISLSKGDPEFFGFIEQALESVQHDWNASIIQNRDTTDLLKICLGQNNQYWSEVMARSRLSSDAVRAMLRQTVMTGQGYAGRFIDLRIVS